MNHHKIEQNGGFKLYTPQGFMLMGQRGGVATWDDGVWWIQESLAIHQHPSGTAGSRREAGICTVEHDPLQNRNK